MPILGKDHIAVKVDVASETSVKDLSTHITSKYNRCPSTVIHAAGIIATGARKSVFEITAQDYDRTLDINLKGTFLINKIFGQRMRDEKVENGSIVNFSSVAGRTGVPYVAEYSASKTGVNSLTESFGKELAQSGIRVNAVAPFFVRTPLLDVFPEHKLEQAVAFSPSQRMGKPEEIARVCLFLASKDSAYISGQILHVTGGF